MVRQITEQSFLLKDILNHAGYLAQLHFVHGLIHLLLEQVGFGRQCLSVCS